MNDARTLAIMNTGALEAALKIDPYAASVEELHVKSDTVFIAKLRPETLTGHDGPEAVNATIKGIAQALNKATGKDATVIIIGTDEEFVAGDSATMERAGWVRKCPEPDPSLTLADKAASLIYALDEFVPKDWKSRVACVYGFLTEIVGSECENCAKVLDARLGEDVGCAVECARCRGLRSAAAELRARGRLWKAAT